MLADAPDGSTIEDRSTEGTACPPDYSCVRLRAWMLRAEAGFTLIEVLVAATILVVGISGTLGLLIGANSSTTASANTEGATNLAREVSERVRQLPPGQI